MRRTWIGYAFAAPWLVGLVLLVLYPFLTSLYWSFCRFDLLSPPEWIGSANYERIAIEMRQGVGVGRALWNTLYYAFLSVPLSVVLGVALAILASWEVKGQAIFRTLFFLPCVVPTIAAAILWAWLLDPRDGPVNRLLHQLGLPGPGWFTDYREAAWLPAWFLGQGGVGSKDAMVLMSLWGIGNLMVIYLGAIGEVPRDLLEAAELDGANRWHRFRFVTLPLLTPVILFNLVMGWIQAFQAFAQMYVISEGTGNPERSLLVLSIHLFLAAFQDLDMGYASAIAWMTFVLLAGLTFALFRTARYWVFYQGSPR